MCKPATFLAELATARKIICLMANVLVLFAGESHGAVKLPLLGRARLLDVLMVGGIHLAHECGGKLACATCQIIVREGLGNLKQPSEDELDILDAAGASAPGARLACQAIALGGDLVIEIPPSETTPPAVVPEVATLPVSLTERAATHIAAQLASRPAAAAVRLGVAPAGCSGYSYRLEFADAIRDSEVVFESHGIHIAVEASSLPHVQGTRLDLVREGLAQRLRFDNPNARSTCGCGESFGL